MALKKLINITTTADSEYYFNVNIEKISNLGKYARIKQLEVCWDGLTGTLTSDLKIYQKSNYSETLIKTILFNTSSGSELFPLVDYLGQIKIKYTANLVASGNIFFVIYWE